VATRREDYERMKGPSLAFALLDAFHKAGVSDDSLWELAEPHNAALLRRAASGLGTRKAGASTIGEQSQPV
jgi:hypothetical protein